MAADRLLLVAAGIALISLLLNAAAALSSGWVLQVLEDGHRRTVGLWRVCGYDTNTNLQADDHITANKAKEILCHVVGWGADLAGYQESRSTVKLQFDMMRACNMMAMVALFLGQLILLLGILKVKNITPNSSWWEEAIAALFQLASFLLVIGLVSFFRIGPYTQLSYSCYMDIGACLFATLAAAMLIWDILHRREDCTQGPPVIVISRSLTMNFTPPIDNEYVESPC